ncbi:hypothetical protein C8R45DRAFT_1029684 [Mycena sanguinolenta]|nr:hypothetical protein C8R45DRAFT_1029684 [Mycena sanguinolenta]
MSARMSRSLRTVMVQVGVVLRGWWEGALLQDELGKKLRCKTGTMRRCRGAWCAVRVWAGVARRCEARDHQTRSRRILPAHTLVHFSPVTLSQLISYMCGGRLDSSAHRGVGRGIVTAIGLGGIARDGRVKHSLRSACAFCQHPRFLLARRAPRVSTS